MLLLPMQAAAACVRASLAHLDRLLVLVGAGAERLEGPEHERKRRLQG